LYNMLLAMNFIKNLSRRFWKRSWNHN
jgi:hypothetical protein